MFTAPSPTFRRSQLRDPKEKVSNPYIFWEASPGDFPRKNSGAVQSTSRYRVARTLNRDEVTESVIGSYVEAIKKYIEANRANDEDSDEDDKDQCRDVINSAVSLLEKARKVFDPETRKDPNRPLPITLQGFKGCGEPRRYSKD